MDTIQISTLTDIITDLHSRGFTMDFNLSNNSQQLICIQECFHLTPSEFDICELHYFPEDNGCAERRMLYAIEARNYGIKGLLLLSGGSPFNLFPGMMHVKIQDKLYKERIMHYNGIL